MIQEAYVSYETAKLLKEKGFDESCRWAYDPNSSSFAKNFSEPKNSELSEYEYSKPTQAMAMRWLREIHNINIDIVSIWNLKRWEYQVFIITPSTAAHPYVDHTLYMVYEEAIDAALGYILENLI